MQENPKVGIFDSGIGGLSILSKLVEIMPDISISYIADDLFFPYGEKNDEEIIERSSTIVRSLLEVDVDLIVVACNSATASSIAILRDRFDIPFVGVEPFLNIYNHEGYQGIVGKCVVLTTEATGRSEKFQDLKKSLDPTNEIEHYSFIHLAALIEDLYDNGPSENLSQEIENELAPLKSRGYEYAILGCTHYPFIASKIESYLSLKSVDPAIYVAKRVRSLLAIYEPINSQPSSYQFKSTSNGEWQSLDTKLLKSVNLSLS